MSLMGLFLRARKTTRNGWNVFNRRSLLVEALEDRSLMAAVSAGIDNNFLLASGQSVASVAALKTAPTAANRAAVLTDDRYEQNDTQAVAINLGTLNGPFTAGNLVMADGADWYKF